MKTKTRKIAPALDHRSLSVRLGRRPATQLHKGQRSKREVAYITRFDDRVQELLRRAKAKFDGTGFAVGGTERDFFYRATDRQEAKLQQLLKRARIPVVPMNWKRGAEERIYAEQERMIARRFGRDVADHANYGWCIEGGRDYVSVETKVYAYERTLILRSIALKGRTTQTPRIKHEWADYFARSTLAWRTR